jgi:hypothetical protein
MRQRIMTEYCYAEYFLRGVSFLLNATNMPFMMNVVILSVTMLNVVTLSVIMLSVVAPDYNLVMLLFKLKIPKTFLIKAYITRLQA